MQSAAEFGDPEHRKSLYLDACYKNSNCTQHSTARRHFPDHVSTAGSYLIGISKNSPGLQRSTESRDMAP